MGIDSSKLLFPKSSKAKPSRKTAKGRKDRAEAAVKRRVRAACVERDGYCRRAKDAQRYATLRRSVVCEGPSQWSHLAPFKRAHTRGMPPEIRHQVAWSLMLCKNDHDLYDAGRLLIEAGDHGADGPLTFTERTR